MEGRIASGDRRVNASNPFPRQWHPAKNKIEEIKERRSRSITMRSRNHFPLFAVAALSAIAMFVSGCSGGEKKASAQAPSSVPVVVATVAQKSIPVSLRSIGNVQPFQTVSIK